MSRQWVRRGLVIIMLVVVLASGYRVFLLEQQRVLEGNASATYGALAWDLSLVLTDLQSGQRAYVASGQSSPSWFDRVAARLVDVRTALEDLRILSTSLEAVAALRQAELALDRLQRVDAAAREHTSAGQALMASDLVFNDGPELVQQVIGHLGVARLAESTARGRSIDQHRDDQLAMVAVGAAAVLIVTLALLPAPRRGREPAGAGGPPDADSTESQVFEPTDPLTINVAPPSGDVLEQTVRAEWSSRAPVESGPAPGADSHELAPGAPLPGTPTTAVPPAEIVPSLKMTAQICHALGQVSGSAELEAVLGRVSKLLNASGLIVWVRDSTGRALRPATGHGYSPHTMGRLGHIACDSDNAAAAAYRTNRLQVVSGGGDQPGAIVVPLSSTSAPLRPCFGVLSAEVLQGWEASEAVQETASIVAAQLATLLTADTADAEVATRNQAHAHG